MGTPETSEAPVAVEAVGVEGAEKKEEVAEPVKVEEAKKPSGISLPMTGANDDWMDDDVGLTMDDSDEEEDKKEDVKVEEPVKVAEPVKVEEVKKPSGISLPMTEANDDWMDDDVGLTMDDSDDEEDVKVEAEVPNSEDNKAKESIVSDTTEEK